MQNKSHLWRKAHWSSCLKEENLSDGEEVHGDGKAEAPHISVWQEAEKEQKGKTILWQPTSSKKLHLPWFLQPFKVDPPAEECVFEHM